MIARILILGACGQIGTELTFRLREIHGAENVIASDIKKGCDDFMKSGPVEFVNVKDNRSIAKVIDAYKITDVYLMAAMLSATAEKFPAKGWELNMSSLFIVLNLAKERKIKKIFWPSSIAVFGPSTPKYNAPQKSVMEPKTVYGISKLAGERWCEYYFEKYRVDVRSIRFPGIISWKTIPGGGTTDYAVEIYHSALRSGKYESFLSEGTKLPMMYMDDAIEAAIRIMSADEKDIKIHSSYNVAAISFSPREVAKEIKNMVPEFKISYSPDFRQDIADSWPQSIDDSDARKDWNWRHCYDLGKITRTMLNNLKNEYPRICLHEI